MDESFREFNYFLDSKKENQLFIKFEYSADFLVNAFVIIYLTKVNGVFEEVVKYDYSKRETLHVHYFFKKHSRKEYLGLPPTIDTLFELKIKLTENWQKYLIKFNKE
jgi:hypothetical protein